MGLAGYDKRFLNLIAGAPGSTHDPRLLCNTGLFKQVFNGQGFPGKTVGLGNEYGKFL